MNRYLGSYWASISQNLTRGLSALSLGLLLAVAAAAAQAETLTNTDVIKLVNAGLGSETISLSIRSAANTKFDITANGLAALSEAGVPDSVVQTMIKRGSGATAVAPAARSVPAVISLKTNKRKVLPAAIEPVLGNQYYTRFNLWYERSTHKTTNYSRGALLPINSKVTLTSMNQKKLLLTLESGKTLTIALVQKFSLRPVYEIASELLATQAVPISRLGKEIEDSISQGTMRLGMTREQVLMTRGYPPRHKTPSLDSDRWIYWSSRFVYRTLVFQDDVLTQGRGLN